MFKSIIIILFLTAKVYSQTPDSIILKLNWLSGSWISKQDNIIIEEMWMTANGNIMPGTGRTILPNKKTSFEFMRIAQTDSGIYFYGSPEGQITTAFKLLENGKRYILFENLQHDFPQRILYKLIEPGKLYARVEGIINNKMEFIEFNYLSNDEK